MIDHHSIISLTKAMSRMQPGDYFVLQSVVHLWPSFYNYILPMQYFWGDFALEHFTFTFMKDSSKDVINARVTCIREPTSILLESNNIGREEALAPWVRTPQDLRNALRNISPGQEKVVRMTREPLDQLETYDKQVTNLKCFTGTIHQTDSGLFYIHLKKTNKSQWMGKVGRSGFRGVDAFPEGGREIVIRPEKMQDASVLLNPIDRMGF